MMDVKHSLGFKLAVFGILAVSMVLLPGAISGASAESAEMTVAVNEAVKSITCVSAEVAAENRAEFVEFGKDNPLFALQMNAQKFEPRHHNLWK